MRIQPTSAGRLAWLDGLRALAILLVIARHVYDRPFTEVYGRDFAPTGIFEWLVSTTASLGWIGVHLFFVISGFLVAGSAIAAAGEQRFAPLSFLGRRFVRVFVPALIFLIAWGLRTRKDFFSSGALLNFLFVENFTGDAWLGHYWSLCVEAHFYLAAALVAWALSYRGGFDQRRIGWAFLVIAAMWAMLRIIAARYDLVDGIYVRSQWQADFFLLGASLSLLFRHSTVRLDNTTAAIAASVIILAYGVLATYAAGPNGYFFNQKPAAILAVVMTGALVLAGALFVVAMTSGLGGALGSRPLRWIGERSYSLYLVHLPFIETMSGRLKAVFLGTELWTPLVYALMLAVSIGGSIAIGIVFYICVERPALRAKDFDLHQMIYGRRKA